MFYGVKQKVALTFPNSLKNSEIYFFCFDFLISVIAVGAVKSFPGNVNSNLFPARQENKKNPATIGNCFSLCHFPSRFLKPPQGFSVFRQESNQWLRFGR